MERFDDASEMDPEVLERRHLERSFYACPRDIFISLRHHTYFLCRRFAREAPGHGYERGRVCAVATLLPRVARRWGLLQI